MRYSIGRNSVVAKSTGYDVKKKRRYLGIELIKLSSGEGAAIRHATGVAFERKGGMFVCPLCRGSGERADGGSCRPCCGTGMISLGTYRGEERVCPLCKGRGVRPWGLGCPDCRGRGTTPAYL